MKGYYRVIVMIIALLVALCAISCDNYTEISDDGTDFPHLEYVGNVGDVYTYIDPDTGIYYYALNKVGGLCVAVDEYGLPLKKDS